MQTGATPIARLANPARDAMIDSQLQTCGVTTPRLVEAFRAIAREEFLPEDRRGLAYVDAPHPLGADGRELMAPLSLGRLLERADPQPADKVLIVGANTGYSAAILAQIVASVTALEFAPVLAARARELLRGFANVTVVEGPLEAGWATGAPYDLILIDGAVQEIPDMAAQVRDGGRVAAIIVGDDGVARASSGRQSSGIVHFEPFADAAAAVLPPFRKAPKFRF